MAGRDFRFTPSVQSDLYTFALADREFHAKRNNGTAEQTKKSAVDGHGPIRLYTCALATGGFARNGTTERRH